VERKSLFKLRKALKPSFILRQQLKSIPLIFENILELVVKKVRFVAWLLIYLIRFFFV